MSQVIFHIDANSAYLSWQTIHDLQHGGNIDYREIPAIVGGDPKTRHGIVLAKSIPAKQYGIQTGESVMEACRKCPNLFILPANYYVYKQASDSMISILQEYSPHIQRFSVDECFLDFTNMERYFGDPVTAAYAIKDRIKSELGFTVNIGISSNKLLAKMGGDLKKPDMVHTLFPDEIESKMWPLPIEDLFMCGRATTTKLHKLGIYTIGALAKTDLKFLLFHLKSYGKVLWEYANGIESSSVRKSIHSVAKGMGNSTTIAFDVTTDQEALLVLLSLTETVAMRLRDGGYCARLISISIRTNTFSHYSHQHMFFSPTNHTTEIFERVKLLFRQSWKGEPIRHLGVRASELCSAEFMQTTLFDEIDKEKQQKIDKAIDDIRLRYGSTSVLRACFLNSGIRSINGGVGEEDYPLMSSML